MDIKDVELETFRLIRNKINAFDDESSNDEVAGYVKGVTTLETELCRMLEKPNEQDRKHGYWHLLDECSNEGVYCSVCSKKVYRSDYANQKIKSKYCPNCGAIMDLQADNQ